MLTPDMRAVIKAAHLCFVATVTPEGRPNLSPKGTIRVWDDAHLFPVAAVVRRAIERAAPHVSWPRHSPETTAA